jgi:hypothetical protein
MLNITKTYTHIDLWWLAFIYKHREIDERISIRIQRYMCCFTVNWALDSVTHQTNPRHRITMGGSDPVKTIRHQQQTLLFPSIHLLSFLRCADDDVLYAQLRCDVRSDPLNSIVILSRLKTSKPVRGRRWDLILGHTCCMSILYTTLILMRLHFRIL